MLKLVVVDVVNTGEEDVAPFIQQQLSLLPLLGWTFAVDRHRGGLSLVECLAIEKAVSSVAAFKWLVEWLEIKTS